MKSLEYYMSLDYPMELIEDAEEGGYAVHFPDLPGCLTCEETKEQAINNSVDCRLAWFSTCLESGIEIPMPNSRKEAK